MFEKVMKRLERHLGLSVFRVLSRPLDLEAAPPAPVIGALRFTRMSEEELLPHCADAELELSATSVRAALARGDVCVGALLEGRLLGYAWFAFGATPESGGVWLEFGPRVRYSYKHFVRPGCRGQRIAAGLLPAADALCAERGRTHCLTLIHPHNRASIRASERSGARSVGYAACLKVFGRLLCWRSAGAQGLGLRFFRPQSNFSPFSLAMRRLASMLAATASRN
jgi:GNAT superfamily N-acetyltransferase